MAGNAKQANYSRPDFWEAQYESAPEYQEFEWYVSLEQYCELLMDIIEPHARALNIGCGTSVLPAELHRQGRKHLTNIDISESCIAKMKEKYADLRELEWAAMDATKLSFPNDSFDVVLDKATSDVFLAVRKPELEAAREKVLLLFREAWRVLRPGGVFVIITRFRPTKANILFKRLGWRPAHRRIPAPRVYSGSCHIYTITKPPAALESSFCEPAQQSRPPKRPRTHTTTAVAHDSDTAGHPGEHEEGGEEKEDCGGPRKRKMPGAVRADLSPSQSIDDLEDEDSGGSDDDTSSDDGSFHLASGSSVDGESGSESEIGSSADESGSESERGSSADESGGESKA
jgi:SAM-dependent methyltransferase